MIRWLHISDLHFNSDDMSTTLLRNELPKFLKRNNIRCDYVFCTGDIRIGRTGVFPDAAADYLKNLCITVGADTSRLFIVPGNHDIDRNSPGRNEAIERVEFQRSGYYNPKYGTIKDSDLRTIHESQKEFRDFLSKVYDSDRLSYYSNPLAPHFNIETPDFNILHVDSTITQREGQEANDLIIGTKALLNACENLNPDKPTILLTHFPFTSLLQDEKKYVSELLYRHGVQLWIAGHEHDHNLQPVKYLYSVQAGELQMEDNTHATVLIGNYDPATMRGYISAYTWFPEGWAEYPIIWHDYAEENKFPFALRLPKDNGLSREAVLVQQANQSYYTRLPEEIIQSIFPAVEIDSRKYEHGIHELLLDAWNSDKPHIILLADGGMGKSTMLLDACRKMENALYVSPESLLTISYGIEEYCAHELFDGSLAHFRDFTKDRHSEPDLILVVDGLNEVDGEAERKFITEIKRLNLQKGIQIIISSRSDFTPRYSMAGYQVSALEQLSDDQVKAVFEPDKWKEICETPTLLHLLRNPMMLTMYKEVSPIIEKHLEVEFLNWKTPIQTATDLLHNYYMSQIAVLMDREGRTGNQIQKAVRAVFDVLPYVAYQFESNYRFNIENKGLRELAKKAVGFDSFESDMLEGIAEYFRIGEVEITAAEAIDILTNELHLLHRTGEYTAFPHQIHRDYLSACWISKETDRAENIDSLWNWRGIPRSVMEHIRQMSGDYWTGIADKVHASGRGRDDVFHLVGNLLDCFPYIQDTTIPDYSELNLCGLQLPNYGSVNGKISLKQAKIDKVSIGKRNVKPANFSMLRFSEDNSYLASVRNNQVVIYSLLTNEKSFWQNVGGGITRLEFVGDYLLAVVSKSWIAVFKHENEWQYVGEIKSPDDRTLFNNRLRSIILKDEVLYFYYNNRIREFDLQTCEMILNKQIQHAWENPVGGYDLTILSQKQPKSRIREQGIICRAEHNGLIATARDDGDLKVTSGREIYHQLSRGITLLKDGAISGNGKWATTLSYEIFSDGRKIQYWNLDEKKKVDELYCPQEISHIHLSEAGNWILGETEDACWVLNVESREEQWFGEHFISNQHSKLVTYGDWVFRKDDSNDIYLYNLRTGEQKSIENRSKNARIATLMPDQSVASVGNNARKAQFKNSRDGREMQVNNDNTVVLGIYGLKKQPFIAVATDDKLISIYHTGTGQRTRKIEAKAGNYIVVLHPGESVIACTDGRNLETWNYYEKQYSDKKRGWWYENCYESDHPITGTIHDISFNEANKELVVIASNGEIIYCHEKYCRFHSNLEIITNFNVEAYDFKECICDDEVQKQLQQNGAIESEDQPEGSKVIYQRVITDEVVEKWREGLKDPVARKRIKDGLTVHQKANTISPDLEILAKIYEGEVSLEFQRNLIEELERE